MVKPVPERAKQRVLLVTHPEITEHVAALETFIEWGRTPHFTISYAQSLGQTGQNLADAVLTTCEQDYGRLQSWFNGLTPSGLPFLVRIQPGNNGASHAGCAATELFCDAFSGNSLDLERMLVVAEADEVFMADQNAGWNCGASNGEALSRVLAAEPYPAVLNGFATAAFWLGSDRQDFVSRTDPTDGNPVSTGCGALFINYLRFQRDIGLSAIVNAGGSTLAAGYQKLTASPDAFPPFQRLLERFFPGTQSNVANDNPFPLMFGDHFYTTSAVERDAAVHPNTAKLFRMFNPKSGDHFYTTSAEERDNAFVNAGYHFEGTSCFVITNTGANSTPLYRLLNRNSGDHFYTTSEAERVNAILQEGYSSEGIACQVFTNQLPDTSPLFRLLNPKSGDHFYTTSTTERDNAIQQFGYQDEGIACYIYGFASYQDEGISCHVFPNQSAGTVPLFRLASTTTIDHFYTTSSAERDNAVQQLGYRDEGIACYLFDQNRPGTVALFRLFNPKAGDHFYTTSAAERDNAIAQFGYQSEGTAAFVLSTQAPATTALFRMFSAVQAWA